MHDQQPNWRALSDRLARICASYPTARPQMIAEVVRAVIDTIGADLGAQERELLRELEELGHVIASAKEEIAALKSKGESEPDVSSASDELDAVVAHTADATNAILEACEMLDDTASRKEGPDGKVVQDATMRIYEACSFQDITGQRITKVVNTLKVVDARVTRIVETFGRHHWDGTGDTAGPGDGRPDAHLLNGPQLPASAMAQADIDALLADF
ncbi:protein phosphatase CheZ [Acetobacteraceae bacterium KSS8]|uniref:Protein phosphatase CheZ n=1 Tax=Endosaccharibacter trunci TaxID=2812733 RepID=A0ABT1W4A1_9PROT|nr:protein phosphatase CheZ [Acetobacteraceae bacterium KSS8]